MPERKIADGLQFNTEVINLIRKHYPKALQGDIEENARCADSLCIAIGGVLAFAFRLNGEVIGRTVLQTIVKRIVVDAASIDKKSGDIIRTSLPTLLN